MGALRTLLILVSFALPAQAGTLPLAPQPGEEQVYQFATCVGRFSALMEHQWMVDGPGSEATAKLVASMGSLVQAITPEDQGRRVLAWRIDAKAAQRALLMQADFGTTPAQKAKAKARSETLIGSCRSLLLG